MVYHIYSSDNIEHCTMYTLWTCTVHRYVYRKFRKRFKNKLTIYTYIVRWVRDIYHIERGNTIEIYIDTATLYAIDEYYSRVHNTINRNLRGHRVPFDCSGGQWFPMSQHLNDDHNNSATIPNKLIRAAWVPGYSVDHCLVMGFDFVCIWIYLNRTIRLFLHHCWDHLQFTFSIPNWDYFRWRFPPLWSIVYRQMLRRVSLDCISS